MSREPLFLDTSYVLALLNQRDTRHAIAVALRPRLDVARRVVTTEAVLLELGNAVSRDAVLRPRVAALIDSYYAGPACTVVSVDRDLVGEALRLYREHADKTWGLTDCVSFVVMRRLGVHAALTADRHFVQAGFEALMLGVA